MAEPLHLQPDPGPDTEQVRIGDQTLELDRESARIIRDQFESLAAQYGAQLEQFRAQALQTVGTQQPMPEFPHPPEGLAVPDPDLLFQNKGAWTEEFARSLEGKLGGVRQEATQLVQGAVQAFQQELNRRDAAQQAKSIHDSAMAEMLERRNLAEHTMVVQAVYNQQYDKLKHLPLELALDKVGALAEEEITRIRSGEQWTITPANTQQGLAPRPPAMLRSARRATRSGPSAPPPSPADKTLVSPGGGLSAMGMIIRKHQARMMGSGAD